MALMLQRFRVSGIVTGLAGSLQLSVNGGGSIVVNGNGSFSFSALFHAGQTYDVSIAMRSPQEACTVQGGWGTIGFSDVNTVRVVCVPDPILPTVLSTLPSDMAIAVAPDPAILYVTFDSPMIQGLIPTLTMEVWDGTGWVPVDATGTTIAWSSADTLRIDLSWIRFPEHARFRWTLSNTELMDEGSNMVASPVVRTFESAARNAYFPMADTGQDTCYFDNAGVWTADPGCMLAYSPGSSSYPYGEDAHYASIPRPGGLSPPRMHQGYGSDTTTEDAVSGLVWKTCAEGLSGPNCAAGAASGYTWYQAIHACAYLNQARGGAGFAGYKNWRLATRFEMDSIAILDSNPALDSSLFPNAPSGNHATASSNGPVSPTAWYTGFYMHGDDNTGNRSGTYAVRCVTGPAVPVAARVLQDQGDGTVSDNISGLSWQKCALGRFSDAICSDDGGASDTLDWPGALAFCENLILASRTDWRLPSAHELLTLVDQNTSMPAIDGTRFPATSASGYWTSTTAFSFAGMQAYSLDFDYGTLLPSNQSLALNVRCVTGP